MRLHIHKKIQCDPEKSNLNVLEYEDEILNAFEDKEFLYEKIKKLEQENKRLQDELDKLKCSGSVSNVSNSTVNSNNIVLNIQLTPYNDPKIENVEKYYKEAIKKMFLSVPTLIERIHFNKDLPENHNILINNFRTKIAKVFDGNKWKTIDEDELIKELINTNELALEDFAKENPKYQQHIDKYNKMKDRDSEEKVFKDLKFEVKRVLYDNRDMVKC
jgi:hypothetical protein